MTEIEFNDMLDVLLLNSIQLTMKLIAGERWYDLNTGMKSHLYINFKNDVCSYQARYSEFGEVEDLQHLLYIAKGCMHGRDFGNGNLLEFMEKQGVLKSTTTSKTTYS